MRRGGAAAALLLVAGAAACASSDGVHHENDYLLVKLEHDEFGIRGGPVHFDPVALRAAIRDDARGEIRAIAMMRLGEELGDGAIPDAEAALDDRDDRVVASAATILGGARTASPAIATHAARLRGLLATSPATYDRMMIASALVLAHDHAALPLLLGDADADVRFRGTWLAREVPLTASDLDALAAVARISPTSPPYTAHPAADAALDLVLAADPPRGFAILADLLRTTYVDGRLAADVVAHARVEMIPAIVAQLQRRELATVGCHDWAAALQALHAPCTAAVLAAIARNHGRCDAAAIDVLRGLSSRSDWGDDALIAWAATQPGSCE